jgi:hypothetical protein
MLLFDEFGAICGVQSFCGRGDEDVEDFLKSYNFYAKISGLNDDLKCHGVLCFMGGIARMWFNMMSNDCIRRRESGGVDVLSNWNLLEDVIRKQFDVEEPMILRYKLSERKQQENESVSDYAVAKEFMINKLNPFMCEEEKLSYFVFGLLPMFRFIVVSRRAITMREAVVTKSIPVNPYFFTCINTSSPIMTFACKLSNTMNSIAGSM